MELFFLTFGVSIEKKKFEKFLSVSRELSLKSRVNFLAISQNSQEHLPGKFQADGYIFQGVLAILSDFFSTFLYILQFSNGHNSLNKLDRHRV